ncbi:uncharacterized protein si:ch211-235f1.3 isoform X3 [Danio rerio]|uniref:Uncharacterized protein si:ch211-235f1.3 isoform X3 n=1 Tax=Danio rerio TaxID=7955 RepID=A0AC58JG27_DANRE
MAGERMSRRLQMLRAHHETCARRYDKANEEKQLKRDPSISQIMGKNPSGNKQISKKAQDRKRVKEHHHPGQAERDDDDNEQISEKTQDRKRVKEHHHPGQAERDDDDNEQISEKAQDRKRVKEHHHPGQAERDDDNEQISEKAQDRKRLKEHHHPGQAEREDDYDNEQISEKAQDRMRLREHHHPGQAEREDDNEQVSEKAQDRKRVKEHHHPGQAERDDDDNEQVSEKAQDRKRVKEHHHPGQAERDDHDEQISEKAQDRKRQKEHHHPGQAERDNHDEQSLGATDQSQSGSHGSEYMPSTSSDSEECSMEEKFLKDARCRKKAELEGDAVDLEHAISEEDDQKEDDKSKITVKTCQKGAKRKWDKRHYCIYCKKPQSKIARHLERKHNKEEDVAKAVCLPKNSKKRRLLLDQLRYKGDYTHNTTVLESGQGELVTYRQPTEETSPHEYLPCNYCYGFFRKHDLWKHEVSCKNRIGLPLEESGKRKRVQAAASCLLPVQENTTKRCRKIISRMLHDEVSLQVKSDALICEYGDRLLEKHGSDPSKDGYVSQKMRELGRFVIAAKKLKAKVKNLEDILIPPMFKLAVDAAKKASGFTASKYRYDRPSLALKLGHSLKTVGDILIGRYVKAENEIAANRVRSFLGLVSSEWNHYVSHRARTNLEENKWNKKEMIPLTEDVILLQKYLKSVEQTAREKLKDCCDPKAYAMLSESILSQIILFNRRRQGEAAKMLLETYENKNTEALNDDVMQCLSKLERDLSNDFTRIVIRGKRGQKVPVLLTKEMTRALDFLIEHRMQENGVLYNNKYVFARAKSDSHIRGSDCLRKFANLCDAKHPETLTSTQLRKHIATLCQIMNLKDHELDQVAKFMGHDIRVHREYYRLTENTIQLAKMSKLLMAIECGTSLYKGKSLDEIDLELEVALSNKPKQGYTSEEMSPRQEHDEFSRSLKCRREHEEAYDSNPDESPDSHTKKKENKTSKPERNEFSRSLKCRREHEEAYDSNPDESPDSHTKTTENRTSKTERNEFSRSLKFRHEHEEAYDSHPDEGPDLHTKTKESRTSKTERNGSSRQNVQKRPWSDAEKKAVWRQLGTCITLLKVPGKDKCLKCLEKEPVLHTRGWRDVKNHVHNTIQSKKKKLID